MLQEKTVEIPDFIVVRELANLMGASPIDVIKELMNAGVMANINQRIDYETAAIIAEEMGFEARPVAPPEEEEEVVEEVRPAKEQFYVEDRPEDLVPRPPVVTLLGHVDHGKTTILDAIRRTNVWSGEAGGITQHIGAYQVEVDGRRITFIDTPGHEAFTAMRARGAQATDIAVLVVAADDGVMPQTREAISHARAAGVPILVDINKIDLASAQPERVKQQLSNEGLIVEEWGGDVLCVETSAIQKTGLSDLLESILVLAEISDITANPDREAMGTVIEAQLDQRRGAAATLLVRNGTLHQGDAVLIDDIHGRIRAMFDFRGQQVEEAPPSMPVEVLGLSGVPVAGDTFRVVEDKRAARELAEERAQEKERPPDSQRPSLVSLEDLFQQMEAGEAKELRIILKADVQGSLEPVANSLERLETDELKVNILHQGIGHIGESDIMLAAASQAVVIGFNVEPDGAARSLAETEGVDVRIYDLIYRVIEDVDKALKGLLEPVYREVVLGHAEVRAIFHIPDRGNVAGCYVTDGQAVRNGLARVRRDSRVVYEGRVASLRRFTEDVAEVRSGYECGVGLEGFGDFEEGDVIEIYRMEQVTPP
ncbi:MAG: translation initiation factor IF-2 [Chloroflexota bacterium]|nr:translation initiation factor IF-2 [Chloroflexota bacterium]